MQRSNKHNQPIGAAVVHWAAASSPAKTIMTGQYCIIEPLDVEAHAASLFEVFKEDNEGKVWTYLFTGPYNSFAEFKAWLMLCAKSDDPLWHVIVDKKTKLAVGLATYMRITPEHGVIEVGNIHFSPRMQRTSIATETMFLMMQRVFDELGYRRYEWKCDSLNAPSRKAAVRLGFSFEGIFRQALVYKGRNRDTAWYSVIDSEWPHLKRAFVLWLAPSNFDESGRQKKPLSEMLEYDQQS